MANALTVQDVRVLGGEPRVLDLKLGERLGFSKPINLRKVVRRNAGELRSHGTIFSTTEKFDGQRAGPASTAYHLNEAQALLVCMFSRTPAAAEVRRQVVQVFLAYRHGELAPARPSAPPEPRSPENNARWSAMEKRIAQLERALAIQPMIESPQFARALAYMPNVLFLDHADGSRRRQRRPRWWSDLPVREAAIEHHRQMTIDLAIEQLAQAFGKGRTPSRSSLGRFWVQLDHVRAGS